jgi:hypothetical protein
MVRNEVNTNERTLRVTNPFATQIDVSLDQQFNSVATVELIDLNGKVLVTKRLPAGQRTMKIDISAQKIPAGVYLLKVKCNEYSITKKLVKQ